MSNKNEKVEVVFIMDRSGSMGGLEADTIGGFNAMLAKQKEESDNIIWSTVLFVATGSTVSAERRLNWEMMCPVP